METFKCRAIPNNKSKIARTFQRVISLKSATKIASNNGIGICMLTSHNKFDGDDIDSDNCSILCKNHNNPDKTRIVTRDKRKAVLEALIAKAFASITTIKAAYAEMQMAQHPYCSDAIQAADQAIVTELKQLSELKRGFLKNELDHLSPQVTLMLAEIQEQQSLMKTYEITIKKLEGEVEAKDSKISSLENQLQESVSLNKSMEKSLSASGPLSMFDNIQFSSLSATNFAHFLNYALRSMKSFAKLMVREMELAKWDLEAAAKAIDDQESTALAKPSHRMFLFESFVCKTMFEGFNYPNFMLPNQSPTTEMTQEQNNFKKFQKLKSLSPKQYLTQNTSSSFARFTRAKYLHLVHAKMECSLFGNLSQRKLVKSGGFPDSEFFTAFAEMARRVWCLHLLAFSFGEEVGIFQVSKNCRFSEVYMESVTDETLLECGGDVDLLVAFTVVPGFKIGKSVIQSQVYLLPAETPVSS